MSEGQEATGTQPVNKQEASGQCSTSNKTKKSKRNRKHAKNNAKKKVTNFEKYQDFKFPDDDKLFEVDVKKHSDGPGAGPEKKAEEGAQMLVENAGACKPDDESSCAMNAQNLIEETNTDDLPSDWIKFRHINDVTVYMHKPTRVCTLSKPYVPQKGNTKTQNIPATAMPSLAYNYALEDKEKQCEMDTLMFKDYNKPETSHCSSTNTKYKDEEANTSNANRKDQIKPGVNVENKTDNKININWCEVMGPMGGSSLYTTGNKSATRKKTNEFKEIVLGDDKSLELNDLLLFASSLSSMPIDMDYSEENACTNFTGTYKAWNEPGYSGKLNYASPATQKTLFMSDNMMEYDSEDTYDDLLSAEQVAEYCKNLFKFKLLKQEQKNWAERCRLEKEKKALQRAKLLQGQSSSKLMNKDGDYKAVIEHTMLNANETGFMTMFHEFVFNELQREPIYTIKEIYKRSEEGLYQATVYINNKRYGVGQGLNKRQAKYAAGRATVPMLMNDAQEHDTSEIDANFFDYVSINDPSVLDYTATAIGMSPYAVLLNYLRQNNRDNINKTMKSVANRRMELTMTVDHLSTTVICENKFTAVHRAAQNILQALHPEIRSWGSLLRLHALQFLDKHLEKMQASNDEHGKARVIEKIQNEITKLRKREEAAANAIMMQTGHSRYFSIVESVTF